MLIADVRPSFGYGAGPATCAIGILQWLHVFFGITWIGLLYYFNFVQIPTMPKVPAELKPGVSKYIAPERLVLFPLGRGVHRADRPYPGVVVWRTRAGADSAGEQPADRHRHVAGADHGVQRVGHHLAQSAEAYWGWWRPTTRRRRRRRATACIASRTNVLLSIPMLLAMTNAR